MLTNFDFLNSTLVGLVAGFFFVVYNIYMKKITEIYDFSQFGKILEISPANRCLMNASKEDGSDYQYQSLLFQEKEEITEQNLKFVQADLYLLNQLLAEYGQEKNLGVVKKIAQFADHKARIIIIEPLAVLKSGGKDLLDLWEKLGLVITNLISGVEELVIIEAVRY